MKLSLQLILAVISSCAVMSCAAVHEAGKKENPLGGSFPPGEPADPGRVVVEVLDRVRSSESLSEEGRSLFTEGRKMTVEYLMINGAGQRASDIQTWYLEVVVSAGSLSVLRKTQTYKEMKSWIKTPGTFIRVLRTSACYSIGTVSGEYHLTKDGLIPIPSSFGV